MGSLWIGKNNQSLGYNAGKVSSHNTSNWKFYRNLAPAFSGLPHDTANSFAKEWVAMAKGNGEIPPTSIEMKVGMDFKENGRPDLAVYFFEVAAINLQNLNFRLPQARSIMVSLLSCLEDTSQLEKAEVWHRVWLKQLGQLSGDSSTDYATELTWLASNLILQKKFAEAEVFVRKSLEIRQLKQAEHWATFHSMTVLGEALMGLEKYTEAEPLLVTGYQGMIAREEKIVKANSQRIPEAINRLVKLYSKTDRQDEAAKWKAEQEKYGETPAKVKSK